MTHGQELALLARSHRLICEEGKRIMNLLKPDLGKLLYLAIGAFLLPKVLSKVTG